MKKFINIRLPVTAACSVAFGVGLGLIFKFYRIDLIWLTAIIPVAAIIFITTILKRKFTQLIFTVILLIFLFSAFLNCYLRINNYQKLDITYGNSYSITGTVSHKYSTKDFSYIIIENAIADDIILSGKIYAKLTEDYGDFCDSGYKVSFNAELNINDAFLYGELNPLSEENIKYSCIVLNGMISEYRFSLFGTVRSEIYNALFENLDYETAAITYAMLTGYTQHVDEDAMQSFRYGGIAHIFAVSGLHIGIVFALISFICKKLKLNKFIYALIILNFIFIYAGICGFTLSSVRAAIMCTVATLCKLIYVKNDGLNSLSIAYCTILFITPLSLFSLGFQLSVCAVGGLCLFSAIIRNNLKKIKCPSFISSAAGTTFGAQLGTMPIMLANFGYLSGAGLLLNIIIVPVLSILFIALFGGTLLSIIIPPIAPVILPVVALPFQAIISFLLNAGFEKALIGGFGAGLFVPLYFLCVLSFSDKFNFKRLSRIICVSCSVLILTAFVLIMSFYPFSGLKISVSAYYGGGSIILKSSEGNILIVTDGANKGRVARALNKNYAFNPKGIIILGGEDCVNYYSQLNINSYDIYVCKLNIAVQPFDYATVHYEKNFSICGINFEFKDSGSVLADYQGFTIGICDYDNPFDYCNLLITKNAENINYYSQLNVFFHSKGYEYNNYEYGDIEFYLKDGILTHSKIYPDFNKTN